MNVIINGAEAIGPGGGRVTIASRRQVVDETYLRTLKFDDNVKAGTYVLIEISDTGCGMDEQTVARIFDPFFTTKFAGRGLGLAAVQGIVRGHKGALKVYTTPGQGTTFRVLFPATAASRSAEPAPPPDVWRPVSAGTVLVIDDEEIIRSTASSALRRLGYAVLTASDGSQGVEVFRALEHRISVVLLDMTMPGMSGEETLQQLRRINPAVPVVLSSGFGEAEALRRFRGHAVAGFLQKPYTIQALAERVQTATAGA
jgi:CheY-like chemotaxis protein